MERLRELHAAKHDADRLGEELILAIGEAKGWGAPPAKLRALEVEGIVVFNHRGLVVRALPARAFAVWTMLIRHPCPRTKAWWHQTLVAPSTGTGARDESAIACTSAFLPAGPMPEIASTSSFAAQKRLASAASLASTWARYVPPRKSRMTV
jgi:hypothetical protein